MGQTQIELKSQLTWLNVNEPEKYDYEIDGLIQNRCNLSANTIMSVLHQHIEAETK